MKSHIYLLLALALAMSACSLAPSSQLVTPTKTSVTTQRDADENTPQPSNMTENTPDYKGFDVSLLTESDTDILGIYQTIKNPYTDAIKSGGRVVNLEPMDTFFVLWVPDGYKTMATRRVMVIAHGHGGNAYREMANELEFAQKYGYAIVAIQWGNSDGSKMYSGQQFYDFMNIALQYMAKNYNAQINKTAMRGWSLGSEISFEVTYLDKVNGTNYLALTISHDGGLRPDPETMSVGKDFARDLYAGAYGDAPFADTHFYLYAGNDEQSSHMKNTEQVITSYGGTVEKLILDENAGHDGFYRHPQYHEEALEIFFELAP